MTAGPEAKTAANRLVFWTGRSVSWLENNLSIFGAWRPGALASA